MPADKTAQTLAPLPSGMWSFTMAPSSKPTLPCPCQ
jgi:hypothetical protein